MVFTQERRERLEKFPTHECCAGRPAKITRCFPDSNVVLTQKNPGTETVTRFRHSDGSWRYLAAVGSNALADDAVRSIILNCRDVTESRLVQERLRVLATVDMLTGLKNRSAFENSAVAALDSARASDGTGAALFFIDLDRFKLINDSVGHAVGDQVLRVIGQRLDGHAPENALIGRLGGDEFAMLLQCLSSDRQAERVAAELILALAATIHVDDMTFSVTASIEVSLFPDHADSLELMLRYADLAMLNAKVVQRNAFRVFQSSLAVVAQERIALVEELRHALSPSATCTHFSPTTKWTRPTRFVLFTTNIWQ